MPKRTDIESILIIGSGPIVIGQACEFDYSGTQAIASLKEEGYKVILVNSNPATIMTDPDVADRTYIEPLTAHFLAKVIKKERPDALLPTMGGQTALNLAKELHQKGVLEAYGVELIGAKMEAIDKAEDRLEFRKAMERIGIGVPQSVYCRNMDDVRKALDVVGIPAMIRASYTLGGAGASVAFNRDEFEALAARGLAASPVHEVMVEQSILNWKEIELEMMRDRNDNVLVVCGIENFDPVGVHTGDSIAVAPVQSVSDVVYQKMRNASIAIMQEIGVDSGGCNVQFAVHPETEEILVIEMNPRVSRSSALASKATGYPIAKISAKLSVGYHLSEIENPITNQTTAAFEPTIDYVVVKVPRFDFAKFGATSRVLGPQMKAVGEVMGLGRTFQESFQKAFRSLEFPEHHIWNPPAKWKGLSDEALKAKLHQPLPERPVLLIEALSRGMSVGDIENATSIAPYFLEKLSLMVQTRNELLESSALDEGLYAKALSMGFSEGMMKTLAKVSDEALQDLRQKAHQKPVYKTVDSCAAEFEADTHYHYQSFGHHDEVSPRPDTKKVAIVGSGPNRVGQGVEFDYCCVQASQSFRQRGYETIMINCNPETVSTDFDMSSRLYFEPLVEENVLEVLKKEKPDGVILQLGGQTPLKLAHAIEDAGFNIFGTSPEIIDLAEDREQFRTFLEKLGLKQPSSQIAHGMDEAMANAELMGFPILVRPSFVLGGRSMKIIEDIQALKSYIEAEQVFASEHPLLMDQYLEHSVEIDVDALSDGKKVSVLGVLEHVEEAGVHSGDSSSVFPPFSLSKDILDDVVNQTEKIGRELGVLGFLNIQFAVKGSDVYVIEVNPRASRTVPFVAKSLGRRVVDQACAIFAGEVLADEPHPWTQTKMFTVKSPVFPFLKFPGVDTILGPEMKSTGEVMGVDRKWQVAFGKAQMASDNLLPLQGRVFISLNDTDKESGLKIAQKMTDLGFNVVATKGTSEFFLSNGVPAERVKKVAEGRPHIVDQLMDDQIQLVMNTTKGAQSIKDSFLIRRTALEKRVPYFTTLEGCRAAAEAIGELASGNIDVYAIQDF